MSAPIAFVASSGIVCSWLSDLEYSDAKCRGTRLPDYSITGRHVLGAAWFDAEIALALGGRCAPDVERRWCTLSGVYSSWRFRLVQLPPCICSEDPERCPAHGSGDH